jgi:hypothetical protein
MPNLFVGYDKARFSDCPNYHKIYDIILSYSPENRSFWILYFNEVLINLFMLHSVAN